MVEAFCDVVAAIPRGTPHQREQCMTEVFSAALLCANHGGREFVTPRDIALALRVTGIALRRSGK
jgi:hypothetical protein